MATETEKVCGICGATLEDAHGNRKRCLSCETKWEWIPTENDKTVFRAMTHLLAADRDILCNETKLPRTTVLNALTRLERQGAIESLPENNGCRGRPKIVYVLSQQYGEVPRDELDRVRQKLWHLYQFFKNLTPEDRILCQISGEQERYGEVKQFCTQQCGVRIGCMDANKDGEKHD